MNLKVEIKQSDELSREKFDALFTPDWVNSTVKWYVDNYISACDRNVHITAYGDPVANDIIPMHERDKFLLEESGISPPVIVFLLDTIKKNPSILLHADISIPFDSEPLMHRAYSDLQLLQQQQEFLKQYRGKLPKQEVIIRQSQLDNIENARLFEKNFQLAEFHLPYDQIAFLSRQLFPYRNKLQEALYYRYVLDFLSTIVHKIAPNLDEKFQEEISKVVVIKSNMSNSAFTKKSGQSLLILDKIDNIFFGPGDILQIIYAGHELGHAVLSNIIGQVETRDSGGSLDRVLSEAVAITFEQEIINVLQNTFKDNESYLRKIYSFSFHERRKHYREANRFLNRIYREKHREKYGWSLSDNLEEHKALAYPEAVKLSIELHRHGFTLDDLFDIVDKIRNIVSNNLCQDFDADLLYSVSISMEENSIYQHIIREIKNLQK